MNQTMKILRRIKLVGWHFFENETINFSTSNLLFGENGSGKSTILDAIQLVLTTDTKHFNNAANNNSKRDVRSYVRGKTGEEGATAYKRKGNVISYIALEFYEESRDRFFVIGVKIDSIDAESEPKKKWFCEEGTLDDLNFIVENKPARDDQFRNKGKKISYIIQSSMARDKFCHRLGNLQETFRELVIKSISFKPMKDVRSFVSQFILPEKAIDVETLRDNINALKSMQDTLSEVKRQVAALDGIIAKASDIDQTNRQIIIIDILLKIAELKNIQQNIRQIKNAIEKLEQEKLTLQDNESMISAELSSRRNEYTELLVAINSNEYTRRDFYNCERGITTGDATKDSNCNTGITGTADATVNAKIGLMYLSDYAYASGNIACGNTPLMNNEYEGARNWLYKGKEWTITPRSDSATHVFLINYNGFVINEYTLFAFNIRPTFYLKSSVYVTGGNGSFSNPYTIACDDCNS